MKDRDYVSVGNGEHEKNNMREADGECVRVIGSAIENTCEKCSNASHRKLRREMYCAIYEHKPYEVYFEGAPCEYFEECDELPGKPKK